MTAALLFAGQTLGFALILLAGGAPFPEDTAWRFINGLGWTMVVTTSFLTIARVLS